ncbi:MAG: hypothetical protein U1F05_03450 [Burkholderiales bacterium]
MSVLGLFSATDDVALARELALRAGALLLDLRARACGANAMDARALGDAGDAQANALLLAALLYRYVLATLYFWKNLPTTCSGCTQSASGSSTCSTAPASFCEGRDDWAVHVALVVDGRVLAAAVPQPARDDVFDTAPVTSGTPLPPPAAASARRVVISRSRLPCCAQAVRTRWAPRYGRSAPPAPRRLRWCEARRWPMCTRAA